LYEAKNADKVSVNHLSQLLQNRCIFLAPPQPLHTIPSRSPKLLQYIPFTPTIREQKYIPFTPTVRE